MSATTIKYTHPHPIKYTSTTIKYTYSHSDIYTTE
jgi:hypothetical protein